MANEMMDSRWYSQTKNRADRLIKRILSIDFISSLGINPHQTVERVHRGESQVRD